MVDNSDGDEATRKVARKFGAHYTIEPKPGLKRSRERAFAEFGTEDVVFLDDEATPEPGWLSTLPRTAAQKKSTSAKGQVLNIESRRGKVELGSPRKTGARIKGKVPSA